MFGYFYVLISEVWRLFVKIYQEFPHGALEKIHVIFIGGRTMPTINQIIRHGKGREPQSVKAKSPILEQCPQKRGVCLSVTTTSPKKPNSALRKIARVRLSNKMEGTVYIPLQP